MIAALLIGLGALGGPAWAQYDAPLYPPAPVSPSQPIPLNPYRAVRDPVAPTDATGPSRIDSRNGDSRNMAALPPEVRPETGPRKELPPQFRRTLVDYYSKEPAGTVIVDTPNTYLYLVLGQGKALRYGIGVGREGFTWSGAEKVSRKAEWPDWNPPEQMIERQPYLPRFMAGGDGNPLGARALYLGDTIYRIHGTNQPSTIGTFVSSGCIRLTNEDITDLHSRVKVGTRVVVLPGRGQATAVTTGAGSSGGDGLPRQAARRSIKFRSVDKAIAGEAYGRARARRAEAHRRRRGRRGSRACPCVQGPSGRRRIRGVGRPGLAGLSRTVSVSRLGAAAELNRPLTTAWEHTGRRFGVMRPVANAHATQCGTGRRGHQGHHLPRDQKGSAGGLQAARRKLRDLPRRAAASVSIGGASLGRRDGAKRRHVPVSGLGRELVWQSIRPCQVVWPVRPCAAASAVARPGLGFWRTILGQPMQH